MRRAFVRIAIVIKDFPQAFWGNDLAQNAFVIRAVRDFTSHCLSPFELISLCHSLGDACRG